MRFSEFYGIELSNQDDWFDTYLPTDTNLFVDPFLIYDDTDPRWAGAHDHILDFFGMIFGLVRDSKGDDSSPAWQQAKRLLLFPEPSEFCLGVADGSPNGSGAGHGLQEGMLEGVRTALGLGFDNVPHLEMLTLFQGGMGLDRISDAVCNILKSYFIGYTQEICRRHDIPMRKFRVRNAGWSETQARWREVEVELPENPFQGGRNPVLLVPRRFLKDIPVVTPDAFWSYAWRNHGDELRGDFNWDIARNVDRREKARMARRNPEIVEKYLTMLEQQDREPYSVETDPKLRTRWWEVGGIISSRSALSFVPAALEEFPQFVTAVIDAFRHGIENQDAWDLLWYRNISLPEKKVQALFRSSVLHYCRANGIVLSGESNAGRGPVDFKFSQGWEAQALVEMKLMRNSEFWNGILAQTPKYLIAEEVKVAFFVAIAYQDSEMDDDHVQKIFKAAEMASKINGIQVSPVIIDARRKESASKLKAPKEVRDELHGRAAPSSDDPDTSAA